MRRAMLRVFLLSVTLGIGTGRAGAQEPLYVLDHAPHGTARPTDAVTITFSRPVTLGLDHAVDPSRVIRIEPALRARIEWRDPSTIRIVPLEPLEPAHRYDITVDSTFAAIDGSKLAAPARIALMVRGPAILSMTPSFLANYTSGLDPSGRVRLQLSAPVADSIFNRSVRLAIHGGNTCGPPRSIAYHVEEQRRLGPNEGSYWLTPDSIARSFRRIVTLVPDGPLPAGCAADIAIPSLDSLDSPVVLYSARTAPPFSRADIRCTGDCPVATGIVINFTASVPPEQLVHAVHFEPANAFSPKTPPQAVGAWVVAAKLTPHAKYRITIDSSLRDSYGRRLTAGFDTTIVTADRAPDFGYDSGLVFIPGNPTPRLRVRHLNVDSIALLLMPVPEADRTRHILQRSPRWQDDERLPLLDSVVRVVALSAPINEERTTDIPLPELNGSAHARLVVLQTRLVAATRRPDSAARKPAARRSLASLFTYDSRMPKTLLQSSDLLAHVRLTADRAIVWVTSAHAGLPVRGAALTLLDTAGLPVAIATTNSDGMATLEFTPPAPVLEVRLGGDRSLIDLSKNSREDISALELASTLDRGGLPSGKLTHAFLFSDRGIYRPGEDVSVGAVMRIGPLGAMVAPPAGDSVKVQLARYTDDGDLDTLRDTVMPLSSFGTFAEHYHLQPDAKLGSYTFTVSLLRDTSWQPVGFTTVRVAEYRAPEFLVTASHDTVPRYRGDTIETSVAAKFLFGSPMAHAVVRWSAEFSELNPWEIHIPGLGFGWTVGDEGSWWEREHAAYPFQHSGIDTLDGNGAVRVRIATDSVSFHRGASARIDVSVTDLNRQAVTASTHATVHPASFYLAVRDSTTSWWWPQGKTNRLQLLAVRPDGSHVDGVTVRAVIVKLRWDPPPDGESTGQSPWRADTLRTDTLVTSAAPKELVLPALPEGPIQVVVSALDEKARTARTSFGRYVYGRGGVAGASPEKLPLHVAVDRLNPGDTAVVSFTSPWPAADAWVTTEREGVLSSRLLRNVHGTTVARLPVSERDVPNVFVSVLLLRRSPVRGEDSLASHMRIGYAALRVDDARKHLDIRLRALRAEYRPGDTATIELRVRDWKHRGTRAEATIWGADEGVLALTDYQTPNPIAALYAPVGDNARFATMLRSVQRGTPPWLLRSSKEFYFGAAVNRLSQVVVADADGSRLANGSGPDGAVPRSDFRSTAFFRSGVRTDAAGIARITVKLPENVTTFRLMAVAVGSGDRYGSTQSSLLVTKPVVLRAALPRFIRMNDSVFAGALINARDRISRMIDVTAVGSGVTLLGAGHLRTTVGTPGIEARFAWRGTASDSAHFQLSETDGKQSDAVRVSIPVRPDQSPRATTITGFVRDTASIEFRLPLGVDPERSRVTIRTGTSPVPTIRVARDLLLTGSYACNDQLVAAGRVLVQLLALERSGVKVLGDTVWGKDELGRIAGEMARRYRSPLVRDCWGYGWSESPMHARANLLLLDIRDAGVPVDTVMVQGLATAFTRLLNDVPLFPDTSYGRRDDRRMTIANHLQGRLGAVAFLQRVGVARAYDLGLLRDNAGRLTWEDRVWLAEVVHQSGDEQGARAMLDGLWTRLGDAGNRIEVPDSILTSVGLPSHIRPVARLLGATLLIEPKHPRLGALVERLTTRRRAEPDGWWNEEDHVAATVALTKFALRNPSAGGILRVELAPMGGGAIVLKSGTATPHDTTVSLAGLTRVAGDSTLVAMHLNAVGQAQYFAVTVNEIERDRPVSPAIRGITVERWYERFDDGRTVTAVEEGDLVRVRLRVTVPASREFVTLEDALPAGLEPVDLTLRTSGTLGPFTNASSSAAARRGAAEAGETSASGLFGSWYGGWWSPWGQPVQQDERTVFFARTLWTGSYTLSYIARATTAGRFVRPQAHAEEVFNPALSGQSEGGWFDVKPAATRGAP